MSVEKEVCAARQEPEIALAIAEGRIAWVLAHPAMSDWLKQALRTAQELDPIELRNDVELLRHLIDPRSKAQIELLMSSVHPK